jgi:transposase
MPANAGAGSQRDRVSRIAQLPRPVTRQSGTWRGKSFIRGGRAHLRQALYMPALVAARFNPDLKHSFTALVKAGKPAKVAITAIMRRLLVLANALIRDDRPWDNRKTA